MAEPAAKTATLVFLGRLEDLAGGDRRLVAPGVLAELIDSLDPALAVAVRGPRIRIAINGMLVAGLDGVMVADDDEVAFLPPVSGG